MDIPKLLYLQNLRRSESGIVSLLVTMILMIVMSLIVLGFAQEARHTQNQQLNNQLSSQAFYAAETGVNDTANIISQQATTVNLSKTTCQNNGIYSNLQNLSQVGPSVSYTCVTVNPTPSSLSLTVGPNSTILPLNPQSGNITSVTLTWEAPGVTNPFNNCPTTTKGSFLNSTNWTCGYGVLRMDLVPTGSAQSDNTLENNTMTTFFEPDTNGTVGPVSYANKTTDNVEGVKCSAVNSDCSMTVNGLNSSQYYMRVSSLYKDMSLQITATNASGPVALTGAQISIDSTGKAQDVLRRIQVALPVGVTPNALPDNAIESTDSVCKRFYVMTNYYANNIRNIPGGVITGNNPLCQ